MAQPRMTPVVSVTGVTIDPIDIRLKSRPLRVDVTADLEQDQLKPFDAKHVCPRDTRIILMSCRSPLSGV